MINIKTKNFDNTTRFYEALYKGLDRGLELTGRMFRDEIKERTPVRTRNLQRNFKNKRIGALAQEIYNETPYTVYVEFGIGSQTDWPGGTRHPDWRGFAPRAMMRRGYDENINQVEKILTEELNKYLR